MGRISSYLLLLFPFFCLSQTAEDALRYSRPELNGSVRFRSMGGAMGAMGADISALNNNPAGLGVYSKSDVTGTLGLLFSGVKSDYNDSIVKDRRNSFAFPNLGISGAGVNKKLDGDHFLRSNFAISLNRIANFKNNILIAGNSRGSTMGLAFSAAAQGKIPEKLDQFYEYPAYYYDLIDTVNGSSTLYASAIPKGANNRQEYESLESGGISELAFGGGYSYDDRFYAGWSVGVLFLNYDRNSLFTETCVEQKYETPNAPGVYISSFFQEEGLSTTGKGINLKLGMIYRFNEMLRAGFAYHTGSIYSMKDNYKSRFGISYEGLGEYSDSLKNGVFRYTLTTPQRFQTSLSILLEKAAAINLEVELLNYANMKLKSNPDYFSTVNKYMRQTYKNAVNVKVGFERNIKPVILRGGYAMFGNEYGNLFSGKGVRHAFSLGGGLRWSNKYLDIGYSLSLKNENYYLYNPLYVQPAGQLYSQSFFLITYGVKIE